MRHLTLLLCIICTPSLLNGQTLLATIKGYTNEQDAPENLQKEVRQTLRELGHQSPDKVKIKVVDFLDDDTIATSDDLQKTIVFGRNHIFTAPELKKTCTILHECVHQTHHHTKKNALFNAVSNFFATSLSQIIYLVCAKKLHHKPLISIQVGIGAVAATGNVFLLSNNLARKYELEAELYTYQALHKKNRIDFIKERLGLYVKNLRYGTNPTDRPNDETHAAYIGKLLIGLAKDDQQDVAGQLSQEYYWKVFFKRPTYTSADIAYARNLVKNQ